MSESVSESTKNKKRKPVIVKILLGIIYFILILILCLVLFGVFSALDRKKPLDVLPADYSVYVHTDKVWQALEPLMDLRAADIVLSSPEFVQYRQTFMNLRSSSWRNSKLLALLAARRVDAALYTKDGKSDFAAVVDLSYLSAVTRPLPLFQKYLNVEGLSYVAVSEETENLKNYLCYKNGENIFYVRPVKNLVFVTNSMELLAQSVFDNTDFYSEDALSVVTEKDKNPIRIVADVSALASDFMKKDSAAVQLVSLLKKDSLSAVSFGITDSEVRVSAKIPFASGSELPLRPLLDSDKTVPSLVSRMNDRVQYYTLLNAGTLEDLKHSFFPLVPEDKKIDQLWSTADSLCKMVFGTSLDEILFSWTGKEFALLGLEGMNNPVFAIEIKDENRRAEIFEKLISSIILKEDTSLIVNGVHLPRIMIPEVFQNILSAFNISLPSAYYIVNDGYIYFSLSPEPISFLYSASQMGRKIVKNDDWRAVTQNKSQPVSLSVFYNLAESVPVFLRGDSLVNKILKLYTIGKCDVLLEKSEMHFFLCAASHRAGTLREIPGFPVQLENPAEPKVFAEPGKNPDAIFWLENENTVKALSLSSMQEAVLPFNDKVFVTPVVRAMQNEGALWILTSHGEVYLVNKKLEVVKNFPVLTGEDASFAGSAGDSSFVFASDNGSLCTVLSDGSFETLVLPVSGSIKSSPALCGSTMAVYDKSFIGKIILVRNGEVSYAGAEAYTEGQENYTRIEGIAFGSPAFISAKGSEYMAFVTQAGKLYVWRDGILCSGFPKKLDAVFYGNVIASQKYFYALSSDATLYRISLNGETLAVRIPSSTAKIPYLYFTEPEHNGNGAVFVCADSNVIYGFNEKMELLPGFPLEGMGVPAFADANSDGSADCFTLTIDKKLCAWNLR